MYISEALTEAAGWLAYHFDRIQPFLPTYTHLLLSALFPIYAGAHASLSRPSSAAKPIKQESKVDQDAAEDEEDDEIIQKMEGLSPSDAIVFPLLSGATLAGLYFVIKWLEDPALLNKILNWYFATFSILSVARLVSDGLDVLHSLLFPHDYVDGGVLFHVNPKSRTAIPVDSSIKLIRHSPLPGPFSRLLLPSIIIDCFWFLVTVPNRKLRIELAVRKIFKVDFKLGVHGIEGICVGIVTVLYYNFVDKPWYLTNLMGFGFAYGALQLLSPTTFWTASLILSALFFYDIYFVFFTPMMVSVAKSLDIPVKLLFPSPARPDADPTQPSLSMLGLGDVVLPGIVIGLALRFDLYLHYLYLQKQKQNQDGKPSKPNENSKEQTTKPAYKPVSEGWGDQLWTSSLTSLLLSPTSPLTTTAKTYVPRNVFPKPYLHASLAGYVAGMISTLVAMQVSDHPQPALLYLVPGVLGSLWLTALVKGEVRRMWEFSDAVDEVEAKAESEEKAKTKAKADEGKSNEEKVQGSEDKEGERIEDEKEQDSNETHDKSSNDTTKESLEEEGEGEQSPHSDDRTLVSFRITLPPVLKTTQPKSTSEIFGAIEHDVGKTEDVQPRRRSSRRTLRQKSDGFRSSDEHQDERVRTQ